MLHVLFSVESPGQTEDFFERDIFRDGTSHARFRICSPPPQVFVHVDQSPQFDHSEKKNKYEGESNYNFFCSNWIPAFIELEIHIQVGCPCENLILTNLPSKVETSKLKFLQKIAGNSKYILIDGSTNKSSILLKKENPMLNTFTWASMFIASA